MDEWEKAWNDAREKIIRKVVEDINESWKNPDRDAWIYAIEEACQKSWKQAWDEAQEEMQEDDYTWKD